MHKVGKGGFELSARRLPRRTIFIPRLRRATLSAHINYHRFRTYNLFISPCTVTTPIFNTGSLSTHVLCLPLSPPRKGYDNELEEASSLVAIRKDVNHRTDSSYILEIHILKVYEKEEDVSTGISGKLIFFLRGRRLMI